MTDQEALPELPALQREFLRWQLCDPKAMAHQQSSAAIQFAFEDAQKDIIALAHHCKRLAAARAPLLAEIERLRAERDAARAALVNQMSKCRGIIDHNCAYLGHCGSICNKCGKEHSGLAVSPKETT